MNAVEPGPTVDTVLTASLERLYEHGLIHSIGEARETIDERERLSSTYVGGELALPHLIGPVARAGGVALVQCAPIDWQGQRVSLLLFVLGPAGAPPDDRQDALIGTIARLSRQAATPDEAAEAITTHLAEAGATADPASPSLRRYVHLTLQPIG